MAYGDVGGINPTLIVTCRAWTVIAKSDAVRVVAAYEVSSLTVDGEAVFGVALDDGTNGLAVPVCLRGIVQVGYVGAAPAVGDFAVCASARGRVRAANWGEDGPMVLKVDVERQTVDVLL